MTAMTAVTVLTAMAGCLMLIITERRMILMIPVTYQTIAKFKVSNGDGGCFVKQDIKTHALSCTCRAWADNKHCKHIDYVKKHPFIQLTSLPTYQEYCDIVWGRDRYAKERWVIEHLKPIEI